MSVLDALKRSGGCVGGRAVYFAARELCFMRNHLRPRMALWPDTMRIMEFFLPKLDLRRVRFCEGCSLPPNWFTKSGMFQGITFGYTIFLSGKDYQRSWLGLMVLLHELVHVDQVRRRRDSESRFACDYGKGFLAAGNYRDNPMEVEAFDLVTRNPLPISLPASLQALPMAP
ncbi:MAG: hypothetical protein ACE15C_03460 [Phycisphaerae bacterium]